MPTQYSIHGFERTLKKEWIVFPSSAIYMKMCVRTWWLVAASLCSFIYDQKPQPCSCSLVPWRSRVVTCHVLNLYGIWNFLERMSNLWEYQFLRRVHLISRPLDWCFFVVAKRHKMHTSSFFAHRSISFLHSHYKAFSYSVRTAFVPRHSTRLHCTPW